jgi:hypothetical protein
MLSNWHVQHLAHVCVVQVGAGRVMLSACSTYTAVALTIDYVYQMTFYIAVITVINRRKAAHHSKITTFHISKNVCHKSDSPYELAHVNGFVLRRTKDAQTLSSNVHRRVHMAATLCVLWQCRLVRKWSEGAFSMQFRTSSPYT